MNKFNIIHLPFMCALLCLFHSCQLLSDENSSEGNDFYSAQKVEDLWRVPLLDPFEVVSPDEDSWFLIWENANITASDYAEFDDLFQFTYIERIGILDSVLVLENSHENWPLLSGAYPSTLVLDVKTMQGFLYSREHHAEALSKKLQELGIDTVQMLNWSNLKNTFQEKGDLPAAWSHVK